jgi:hypothetical protein
MKKINLIWILVLMFIISFQNVFAIDGGGTDESGGCPGGCNNCYQCKCTSFNGEICRAYGCVYSENYCSDSEPEIPPVDPITISCAQRGLTNNAACSAITYSNCPEDCCVTGFDGTNLKCIYDPCLFSKQMYECRGGKLISCPGDILPTILSTGNVHYDLSSYGSQYVETFHTANCDDGTTCLTGATYCSESICDDGVDNDKDSYLDCLDSDCSSKCLCGNGICNLDDGETPFTCQIDCLNEIYNIESKFIRGVEIKFLKEKDISCNKFTHYLDNQNKIRMINYFLSSNSCDITYSPHDGYYEEINYIPCEDDLECPNTHLCDQDSYICYEKECSETKSCGYGKHCSFETYTCEDGCNDETDCPTGNYCNSDKECIQKLCSETIRCGYNEHCNFETYTCEAGCEVDANCGIGSYCNPSNEQCVQCYQDSQCSSGRVCDETKNLCVNCLVDSDCAYPKVCDIFTNECTNCVFVQNKYPNYNYRSIYYSSSKCSHFVNNRGLPYVDSLVTVFKNEYGVNWYDGIMSLNKVGVKAFCDSANCDFKEISSTEFGCDGTQSPTYPDCSILTETQCKGYAGNALMCVWETQ